MISKIKIGIITYHSVYNYGAVLQTSALYRFISSLGYDVDIIDYKNRYIEESYNNYHINKSIDFFIGFVRYIMTKEMHKRFLDFRNNELCLSKIEYTVSNRHEIDKNYDLLITGSDQVWNYELNDYDSTYFLSMIQSEKKNSYAASIKYRALPDWFKVDLKEMLKDFKFIGVREIAFKEELEQILGREVFINVDPVFLVDNNEWAEFAGEKIIKKRYLFVYYIGPIPQESINIIREISSKNKLEVINITSSLRHINGIRNIYNAGPKEFINYLMYSSFIITNSFHGTALSIKLQKHFLVEEVYNEKGEIDPRIETVLLTNKVNKCYLKDYNNAYELKEYGISDYKAVKNNIFSSKQFLQDVLKGLYEKNN